MYTSQHGRVGVFALPDHNFSQWTSIPFSMRTTVEQQQRSSSTCEYSHMYV
jgi:hypothetical protein